MLTNTNIIANLNKFSIPHSINSQGQAVYNGTAIITIRDAILASNNHFDAKIAAKNKGA